MLDKPMVQGSPWPDVRRNGGASGGSRGRQQLYMTSVITHVMKTLHNLDTGLGRAGGGVRQWVNNLPKKSVPTIIP